MNPILCAIIPTRKRLARLYKTINSLRQTCRVLGSHEVVLRIDDDDSETLAAFPHPFYPEVKTFVGPRLGYGGQGTYMQEMCSIASAPWCHLIDDDATLEGVGWDDILMELPKDGWVAQTEFYRLNASQYGGQHGPVGFFFPNRFWERLPCSPPKHPPDEYLLEELIRKRNWKIKVIEGLSYVHDRDSKEELERHHAL